MKNKSITYITIVLIVIAVNWIAGQWHTRADLTNENRFTLSTATKKILDSLSEPVNIDVFLKGNYPSGFRQLANSTNDLLREFRNEAGNRIHFRFIAPEEQMEGTEVMYGDSLAAMGLVPINLTSQLKEGQQQQFVYPYALVRYGRNILPVTLYQGKTPLINFQELSSAEALLEYRFIDAIHKLSRTEKPVVGYATGNGEPMDFSVYDMVENVLKTDYNLVTFNLALQPVIPLEIKTLVIVKPVLAFTEFQKLKIDQYIMNGGRVLFFLDRLNAEMDSLQVKNEVIAYDRDLHLNDILFKYGARVNPDLVMDLQCDYLPFDVSGNGQFELLPWNYFPVLETGSEHPVTKNLGFVAGRFVNSIDTVEADNVAKTILLTSSANSRTIQTPALISGRENVNAPEDEKFNKKNIPVAVLLEGNFTSLYANRLTIEMSDSLRINNQNFRPRSVKSKVIIVSDGDIVLNSVMKGNEPIPMGMNSFTYGSQREFPFANKQFFSNSLEYLTDESGLSEAKNKDYVVRLLDSKKVNDSKLNWQLLNIALPVIIVVLFAILFQALRRRKYSTKK